VILTERADAPLEKTQFRLHPQLVGIFFSEVRIALTFAIISGASSLIAKL
jgi:hypothetical protein